MHGANFYTCRRLLKFYSILSVKLSFLLRNRIVNSKVYWILSHTDTSVYNFCTVGTRCYPQMWQICSIKQGQSIITWIKSVLKIEMKTLKHELGMFTGSGHLHQTPLGESPGWKCHRPFGQTSPTRDTQGARGYYADEKRWCCCVTMGTIPGTDDTPWRNTGIGAGIGIRDTISAHAGTISQFGHWMYMYKYFPAWNYYRVLTCAVLIISYGCF